MKTVRRPARRLFRQAFLDASVPAGTDPLSRNAESNPRCVHDSQHSLLAAFWLRSQQNFQYHVGSSATHDAAGFERSSFKRPFGRLQWGKRHNCGSIAGAARLGRPRLPVVTFSIGYQLSPTQPVTRRLKAAPTASGQSVQVESPPPDVSKWYCFASEVLARKVRAKQSLSPHHRVSDTDEHRVPRKMYRMVRQAFSQSSLSLLALAFEMAFVPKKGVYSEHFEGWYQQAPLQFHHNAMTRAKLKAHLVLEESSPWTFVPRKSRKGEKETPRELRSFGLAQLVDLHTKEAGDRRKRAATGSSSSAAQRLGGPNLTRLAALGTRPFTAILTTDIGSLQQLRSIQGAYRTELLWLQHRTSHIIGTGRQDQGTTERLSISAKFA